MREFMHYITNAFYGVTGWNEDNTYQELNATARGMAFSLPCLGCIRLTAAEQSSSTFPSLEGSA
jgi:distribution and morphology protein 10